jgi:hypothetical protein
MYVCMYVYAYVYVFTQIFILIFIFITKWMLYAVHMVFSTPENLVSFSYSITFPSGK